MAFLEGVLGVTVGFFVVLVLARYSGHLDWFRKGSGFIAAGALFYLIDVAWNTGTFATKISGAAATWLTFIWELVAFILIVIGALWAVADLLTKGK